MVRLTILGICLAYICAKNVVNSVSWGEGNKNVEINNIGVSLNAAASQIDQRDLTKTVKEIKNFTKMVQGEGNLKIDFGRGISLQPRQLISTRPKITYKLGKRVGGKLERR